MSGIAAIQTTQAAVIAAAFALITLIGLGASRWRRADLTQLDEWALGGRSMGPFLTWFLQGGSIYTTYSFIAVPALVYGSGAVGFFALPYLVIAYPVAFLVIPRLWEVARARGYVTPADFVSDRFQDRRLTLAVTLTGLLATMPYIALQVYGIELCFSQIGLPVQASLWIAFLLLAVITYVSGLRSATLISVVKDILIWVTVVVAVIYIPSHLGGFSHVFSQVPRSRLTLPHADYAQYATLALGSGLALFLYPHTLTGSLSASGRSVVKRNATFLPVYTLMLGLLAILGYCALVAHVHPNPHYGANAAIPALLDSMFPPWFAGFALAAIAIGALVPASMMAIAAANLFTRNVYVEMINPNASSSQQTHVSKIASLCAKFGAVGFVVTVPTTFVINFQLAAGVWILQTLPAVFLGLFWRTLDRLALLGGWLVGMSIGTYLLAHNGFQSSSCSVGGTTMFIGIPALVANLLIALFGSLLLSALRARQPQS